MAARLRRALLWLRLQPQASIGSPFFLPPTYVCATCGALVAADRREQHDAWDQRAAADRAGVSPPQEACHPAGGLIVQ